MKNYHISTKKNGFFEGWYFKNQTAEHTIAFIPGFSIDRLGNKKAFIQVITDHSSYLAEYDFSQFKVDSKKFYLQIENSAFSESGIFININTPTLKIKGNLLYTPFTPLKYDIMGPFSAFHSMECNHGVLSLYHKIEGKLKINGATLHFDQGIGYVEKDWGTSFPKKYLWTQCNVFEDTTASIMLSIADIPFLGNTFQGCICVIYYKNKEYRLATYKGVRILKCDDEGVLLTQGDYHLEVHFLENSPQPLYAPDNGSMSRTIHENASCCVKYTFFYKNTCIFNLTSHRASLELAL